MKQKLIFTLIAATLAGSAIASDHKNYDTRLDNRGSEAIQQGPAAMSEAQIREHFIRVAELAGFEVLGSSNPDSVALNEMVLTVRPQAERVMWLSDYHSGQLYRGQNGENMGDKRHDGDDD